MKHKCSKNMRGFTLIELIAVLVIMAIIALIVTPLVMNIVKKAKDSANKRSVDAYGKAVELAVATYLLDTGDYPTSLDNLTVEYTGNEVICNIKTLNEDGSIYLSECSVKGTEVKNSNAEDGWYHYGKSSAAAYQSYSVGDVITYNGMDFYVIENSDENNDSVTMLKAEPLTYEEVNKYGGVGTENNHINMYVTSDTAVSYYQAAYNKNGYGGMVYYSSETCGYNGTDNCLNDYETSEIKYVVDAWALDKLYKGDLTKDNTGYSARLITIDELMEHSEKKQICTASCNEITVLEYEWLYNDYVYWTMSLSDDFDYTVRVVMSNGTMNYIPVCINESSVVRPVITLKKSAI